MAIPSVPAGFHVVVSGISAAISGTALASITEADVAAGGKTIVITLTGDAWVASGGTFDAQRSAILQGLDSAQSEGNGWNNRVRDVQPVTAVVRTSASIVTITLAAAASYDITAAETITVTVPGSAVSSGAPIVGNQTFGVETVGGDTALTWTEDANLDYDGGYGPTPQSIANGAAQDGDAWNFTLYPTIVQDVHPGWSVPVGMYATIRAKDPNAVGGVELFAWDINHEVAT